MATLTVGKPGTGEVFDFTTISAAVTAAHNGDVINVSGGPDHIYINDFPIIKKSLTLQAVGGEVQMVATVSPGNGKAMIVAGNPGLAISIIGFDISGVQVPDRNGAAIRYEGGSLLLKDVHFHHNQEGLLGYNNDPAGIIVVDHSEFDNNGLDGHAHNIYAGHMASLTIKNSYFHDALDEGHQIKSRAANNVITGNRIFDLGGLSSYSIDLPNGGNATISNNVIQQSAVNGNNIILEYGAEGLTNPGRTVSIDHNTIINNGAGGKLLLNASTTPLPFTDNKLWNLPASQYLARGTIAASDNLDLASQPFLDTSPLTFDAVCYARGTMIRTPDGELPVEKLRPGKQVITLVDGEEVPQTVIWLGHRRIDLTTHLRPETVAPIRIERDAIADGMPHRDLLVSPDHAIFVDGVLICARQLVNGTTIRREHDWTAVDYYHVELDQHAILLAEGLPAESYLDTGNRGFFASAEAPLVLYPDLTDETGHPTREAGSCAPFVWDEASVRPVWQRLTDRAAALGRPGSQRVTTTDADLRLMANGRTVNPVFSDSNRVIFVLPRGASEVRLVSRAQAPTEARPWLGDQRRLGVRVKRIVLRGAGELREVPMDHPDITRGWWAIERDGPMMSRWTDGGAVLPLPALRGHDLLEIHLAGSMIYAVDAVTTGGIERRAAA